MAVKEEVESLRPISNRKDNSDSQVEEENIKPLKKGTNEVTFEVQRAKTIHWVALIRYFGGIGIIAAITLFSLYVFAFDSESPSYGDAVKLLYLIAGAIVGSLYASSNKE